MAKEMGMWREQIIFTAAATEETHYSDPVKIGERRYVERVAMENSDASNSDCTISIEDGYSGHALYFMENIGEDEPSSIRLTLWLREGERLRFDFTNVTVTNVIKVYITGHIQYEART